MRSTAASLDTLPARPHRSRRRQRLLLPALALATAASALAAPARAAAPPTIVGTGGSSAPAVRPTDPGAYISTTEAPGSLPLVEDGKALPLVVSSADYAGVTRVVGDLQSDI